MFAGVRGDALGWLTVDSAAEAVVEAAGRWIAAGGLGEGRVGGEEVPVLHVLNPDCTAKWADLLGWVRKLSPQPVAIVSAREWVERMEGLEREGAKHPSQKLLRLWNEAYCEKEVTGGAKGWGCV